MRGQKEMRGFRVIRNNNEIRILDDDQKREMLVVAPVDQVNILMSVFRWMGIVDYDPLQESIDKIDEQIKGMKK